MESNAPTISIRDAMVPIGAGQSFFDAVRALGLSAVELEIRHDNACPAIQIQGRPASIGDAPSIAALRQILKDENVRVSALLLATDFSGPHAQEHVAWAAGAIRAAAELDAAVIRIDPLTADRTLPADKMLNRFVNRVTALLEQTSETSIDLGMENHGPIANDPAFLDAVFAAIPDPRLGLTLDTGNFYWFGYSIGELYDLIDRYAPRAKHTHIKNINYPPELSGKRRPMGADYGKYCCALDEGNIDLRRVVHILRQAGYRRDLCIENESLARQPREKQAEILRRDVVAVKKAITG